MNPTFYSTSLDGVSILSANELSELKCETKFNVLLLLRNRYPEGLETTLMRKIYKKFFRKEINNYIFNPDASNPFKDNGEFLGDDISVHGSHPKIFFKVKCGCSDETMQFLCNSLSSRNGLEDNYIEIKSQKSDMSIPDFGNEENGNYSFNIRTQDSNYLSDDVVEVEEVDPLELPFEDTEKFITYSVTKTKDQLSNQEIPIAYYQANLLESTEIKSSPLPYVQSTQNDDNDNNHIISTNNNNEMYVPIYNTGYPDSRKSISNPSKVYPPKPGIYRCPKGCFYTEMSLERHNRACHLKDFTQRLQCSTVGCSETFVDESIFKTHIKSCQISSRFKCELHGCGKTFKTQKYLLVHLAEVHKRKTFKCSVPNCSHESRGVSAWERLQTHERRCRFKFETFKQLESE